MDELIVGSSLGAPPTRKDVLNTKTMFGVLEEEENHGHGADQGHGRVGFEFESQVERLEKGTAFY